MSESSFPQTQSKSPGIQEDEFPKKESRKPEMVKNRTKQLKKTGKQLVNQQHHYGEIPGITEKTALNFPGSVLLIIMVPHSWRPISRIILYEECNG
jgi:hypothetical protein